MENSQEVIHNKDIFDMCKEKFGVSKAEVTNMMEHKPDTSNVKSMRACILKAEGLMDGKGRINKKVIKRELIIFLANIVPKEVVASVVDACGSVKANCDHPEAASRYAKCLITQFEERNITNTFLY